MQTGRHGLVISDLAPFHASREVIEQAIGRTRDIDDRAVGKRRQRIIEPAHIAKQRDWQMTMVTTLRIPRRMPPQARQTMNRQPVSRG